VSTTVGGHQSTLTLFPRLERVWSNRTYGTESLNTWDRERRVCIAKRFPAYFGFGIGNEALSSEELKDFVANITDGGYVRGRVAACVAVVRRTGGTRAAVLLEELISNAEIVPTNSVPGAILSLFDVADLFANLDFSNAADIYSVNEAVSGCFQHAKAATRAYGGIFHLSRAMRVRRLCLSRHAGGRRHVSWLGRRCPGCLTWAAPTQS
jgi:hypothetical protein